MNTAGKFYLGHLWKVPVYVGWEAIILLFFLYQMSSKLPMDFMLVLITAALLTILLHEMGHALVARAAGMVGVTITISALGGYCSYMPEPAPRTKILITMAGPGMNFALAGLFWIPDHFQTFSVPLVAFFVHWMVVWNLLLGIFNSLPLYPLDGGQIFHASAEIGTRSRAKANRATLVLSVISAFGIVAWSAYMHQGQPDLFLIGLVLMLLFTAFQTLR
ncbi:MAG: site-2 protease family protein [Planctomycetes bacterium]|nr:site-2 protease family protein [Planctomycetota bacterium]